MDLSLADLALAGFDREACLAAATACVEASRRYGLATEPVAHLWLAGGHALAGDDAAMEASLADALARDPDDPRILGDLHGRVLATRAFVADDLESLRSHLDAMMVLRRPGAARRRRSSRARASGRPCTRCDDDDLGAAALASCQEWAAAHRACPPPTLAALAVEAVVRGRQRRPRSAAAELVEQVRITRDAIAIGAGHPALPAGPGVDGGHPRRLGRSRRLAAGVRGLLRGRRLRARRPAVPDPDRRGRRTGAPPAGRRHGRPAVAARPRRHRAESSTCSQLVVDGRTTREIADRLPVAQDRRAPPGNLFDRTGVRNRTDLAEIGRQHGLAGG